MEKHSSQMNTPWWNKEKGSWLTATVGPATDKHQAPTHQLKLYVKAVEEYEAWPTIVQLKRKP